MKRTVALLLCLALLISAVFAVSASAGSILPVLGTAKKILYAPALRAVSALETPEPTQGNGGKKDYYYRSVGLDAFDAFSLALAQAGYALDSSATDEETGNITSEISCSDIKLTVVYNPDNETMTVTYPKGVLPSPDEETDQSLVRNASAAEGILPGNIVKYAPSISQISFLDVNKPTTLSGGGQQYSFRPVWPEIYERFSVKLGDEGYSLVSAEQDEEKGEQVLVVAKDSIQLTLHYSNEEPATMKIDYPRRVKPAEDGPSEYVVPLVVDEVFEVARAGVKATVTGVTTVSQYTEDWRQVTPWFTRTSSSTYKAETDDEVFLWMSFVEDNQSADFTDRTPFSSLNVKLVTGGEEKAYRVQYHGASSRVGYVNTRSTANGDIAPQTQAAYQCVFEIPRAEFEAADEIYAEIISREYTYKYVMCIRGENGQLKQE